MNIDLKDSFSYTVTILPTTQTKRILQKHNEDGTGLNWAGSMAEIHTSITSGKKVYAPTHPRPQKRYKWGMDNALTTCRLSPSGWVSHMAKLQPELPVWFCAWIKGLAALFCAFLTWAWSFLGRSPPPADFQYQFWTRTDPQPLLDSREQGRLLPSSLPAILLPQKSCTRSCCQTLGFSSCHCCQIFLQAIGHTKTPEINTTPTAAVRGWELSITLVCT